MSVDDYAKLVFTMILCFAVIGLVLAIVIDDDQKH